MGGLRFIKGPPVNLIQKYRICISGFHRSGSPRPDHITSQNDTERFDSIQKSGQIMSYAKVSGAVHLERAYEKLGDHIEGGATAATAT